MKIESLFQGYTDTG